MKNNILNAIRYLTSIWLKPAVHKKYRVRPGPGWNWLFIIAAIGLTFNLTSCSTLASSRQASQPSEEQQATPLSAGPTRINNSGEVTIEATLQSPLSPGTTRLSFSIDMNTHSIDLDQYDLKQVTFLRDNLKRTFRPSSWQSQSGGHHRAGILTFEESTPIIEKDTSYVELVINNVAEVKERVLRWEVSASSVNSPALNRTKGTNGVQEDHHGGSPGSC